MTDLRPLTSRRDQRGLTLVEMMMALLVFGLVSAAAVGTLRLNVEGGAQFSRASDRLAQLQTARAMLKADLAQIAPRTVRDAYGFSMGPPVQGGDFPYSASRLEDMEGRSVLIALTRAGAPNPDLVAARGTLEHVVYALDGDRLIRRAYARPDITRQTPFTEQIVYDGIVDARAEFYDGAVWRGLWPAFGAADAPRAVALEFDLGADGRLRQLFYVGRLKPGRRAAEVR